MDKESKERVALFRYGVISEFVNGRAFARGEKERLITAKCAQKWLIPGSNRTRISRSVLKGWIKDYREANDKLDALYPKERADRGQIRAVDGETIIGLVALRKELPTKPLPVLLIEARARGIIQSGEFISRATVYRILQTYAEELKALPEDRRKFEAEHVNDMWQSDVMHGPMVSVESKLRKAYLIAIIDDHSRSIIHAEFYLSERLEDYLDVLRKAFLKRGIPRKLYVDNGAAFRSHQLEFVCASLGVALIHAKPYQPQGKGKIERWFRTVRMSFLAGVSKTLSLQELNKQLADWLSLYQGKINSAIKESPQQRFMRGVESIKSAPINLEEYFRKLARRTVRNDRTIAFKDALYETPIELIGKQIQLLYHDHEPEKIEAICNGKSYGFLRLVDANVNYRVHRHKNHQTELIPTQSASYAGGQLFENNISGESHE